MTITHESAAAAESARDSGLRALRAELGGALHLPADPGWDAARRAWQVTADQHPVAVVEAAGVSDVVATVLAARELGLHVAPQGTGHAAGTLPTLEDTVLLRTTSLREVTIDPVAMTARAEAGAIWADVVGPAAEHGLAAVTGMSSHVGVVGFLLGGGLGFLGRSHGLAANSLLAIDAVDAQGRVVRIDAAHNPDLFWAARGGIAPVVVTAVTFRLYPIAEIYAGALLWPIERAADVAHAWREWIAGVPSSVTSLARVLRFPPIPDVPPMLRGRAFVGVEAAIQEENLAAAAMLQPLRALQPEFDFVRPMSPAELGTVHGDPEQPSPAYGDSVLLAEISAESVDAFVDAAMADSSSALLSIELRHLGAELAPDRGEGGAVAALDGEGLIFAVGITPTPEIAEAVAFGAEQVVARVTPFASPRRVKNFCERPADAEPLYGPALDRIRRVVTEWDPEGVIRTAHPLP